MSQSNTSYPEGFRYLLSPREVVTVEVRRTKRFLEEGRIEKE